ncbi:LamG-like jellyroll fold domain-containing protein, partial [Planctomycetota bacterium]
ISADGLLLFLNSYEPSANDDLYVARRSTTDDEWEPPINLGPNINTKRFDLWPDIAADGSTLYFASDRPGGSGEMDLWQAPIVPVVDLNSDDNVDSIDLCIMVDHWGTDESLCDIGPMPWGDGIVDVQDLVVLAEHLFEDLRLIAQWELDEIEGDIAYDSIDDNHGNLNGNPIWQPASGKLVGALEFDGIDDYVSTPFVLNSSNSSLCAFAWIKGGAPGQAIISQTGDFGGTWLGIEPTDGTLMTGFSGMYFGDLVSGTVITDSQWHHVGFEYDMDTFHRQLYVDGALVAEDATVVSGMPSDGGLHIGASKDLDAGTFFSGLIDDVRIYNQTLSTEEIAAMAQ